MRAADPAACDGIPAAICGGVTGERPANIATTGLVIYSHGPSGYSRGCRCGICRADNNGRGSTRAASLNGKLRGISTRHGYQWTGPELELAAREDLTASQVAGMIGRTLYAVKNMRRKLREDPKIINVAGISTPRAREGAEGRVHR